MHDITSKKGWLFGSSLLLLVGVLGWLFESQHKHLTEDMLALTHAQLDLEKQMSLEMQTRLTPSDIEAQIAPIAARVVRLSQSTLQHMTLAESAALVQMAAVRVQSIHEAPIALYQLRTAEAQLASLGNRAFLPLQEAIGALIQDLVTMTAVPWEHRWVALGAISHQLNALPWVLAPAAPPAIEPISVTADTWQEMFEKVWKDIFSLIRIRSISKEARNIVTVEERAILVHALQLSLEEARWALIQQNNTVYYDSIDTVLQQVEVYFQQEDPTVQEAISQLKKLKSVSASATAPDFSGVLGLYQQALAQVAMVAP